MALGAGRRRLLVVLWQLVREMAGAMAGLARDFHEAGMVDACPAGEAEPAPFSHAGAGPAGGTPSDDLVPHTPGRTAETEGAGRTPPPRSATAA
jgi:hypothetical protein